MPKVVFEDDSLLVFNKPPGLVVDSSQTNQVNTLEHILIHDFKIDLPRGGIVHRLDKDTSGLLLVAKTAQALDNLQQQFQTRSIKKEYLTLVHGLLNEGGRIEGNIGRNPDHREKFGVLESGGKEAVTEYQPLERLQLPDDKLEEIFEGFNKIQFRKLKAMHYQLFTQLLVKPETGRTHQIRVHLKHKGTSIVSDDKYGGRKVTRLDHRWCPRQFLHAKCLEFNHPVTGERMNLEAKLPEDLKGALSFLEEVKDT